MILILKKNKGITLIEILISLTILVSILILSASFIKKRENSIKKIFRQFISINRQLDHLSRLKKRTYRLVIQLDNTKNSWWIESNKKNNKIFIIDKRFFTKPQFLPKILTFNSIELTNHKKPITKGKAYIYYFPEGQFTLALIQLKGKTNYWSIFIDRIKGELTVFNKKKSLKDFKQ